MRLIARPRQMGKTTALMLMADGTDLQIVTHNHANADNLAIKAQKAGLKIVDPVCYSRLCQPDFPIPRGNLLLDDAEYVLEKLLKTPRMIEAITVTAVPGHDYDERQDWRQYEEFQRHNPDMTYREFVDFKYGTIESI